MTCPAFIYPQPAATDDIRIYIMHFLFDIIGKRTAFHHGSIPGSIEPESLYGGIIRHQFFNLIKGKSFEPFECQTIFLRFDRTSPILVIPVDDGKIKINIYAFGIIGIHIFLQQITAVGSVGYRIVRIFAGP